MQFCSFNCLPDDNFHTKFEPQDLDYSRKRCGLLSTQDFAGISFRRDSVYNRPGRWFIGLKRCSEQAEDETCNFGVTGNVLLVGFPFPFLNIISNQTLFSFRIDLNHHLFPSSFRELVCQIFLY